MFVFGVFVFVFAMQKDEHSLSFLFDLQYLNLNVTFC